jgi:predicted methyltransferase
MPTDIILSHYQAKLLREWHEEGFKKGEISLDLGMTKSHVELLPMGVLLNFDELIPWDLIDRISESKNSCFQVKNSQIYKIAEFSNLTNQLYSLLPTELAPTMMISGIPMHRIKGIDPYKDTLEKIKALQPLSGFVLDTATGLGYTAIEAAKYARQVTTIELDPVALKIAKRNPWSKMLFSDPRIEQLIGDSYDVVKTFKPGYYTCIIHDPPAFSLAGHLYGSEFYLELYRVLKRGGRLFHYIGNPESRSGRNITQGVLGRLRYAGFRNVRRRKRAFGVVASKYE